MKFLPLLLLFCFQSPTELEIAKYVSVKQSNLYLVINTTRFQEYYDNGCTIGLVRSGSVIPKGDCYRLKLDKSYWSDKENYDADLNEHKVCLKDTINFISMVYVRVKPKKKGLFKRKSRKKQYRP